MCPIRFGDEWRGPVPTHQRMRQRAASRLRHEKRGGAGRLASLKANDWPKIAYMTRVRVMGTLKAIASTQKNGRRADSGRSRPHDVWIRRHTTETWLVAAAVEDREEVLGTGSTAIATDSHLFIFHHYCRRWSGLIHFLSASGIASHRID